MENVTDAKLLSLNINDHAVVDFSHIVPGVKSWPLFLDPDGGTYVLYSIYAPGTRLARHVHAGSVHFFTTKGRWHYLEHPDEMQTPGSYLYEPAGSMHTLCVPDDAEEGAEGFMVVSGPNIDFGADGSFLNITDVGWIERMTREAAERAGNPMPRYIRSKGAGFSDA